MSEHQGSSKAARLADSIKDAFTGRSEDERDAGWERREAAGTAEIGAGRGPWAVYLGTTRFDESGWRPASDSALTQAVADLGYRTGRL